MSGEYTFDQSAYNMPRILVAQDWQNDTAEEYANTSNSALCETINESYMTADETGNNATQYFSVLETTNETILNDISQISLDVTRVGNEYIMEEEANEPNECEDQGVVLFRVDGSEDLYGIQMAQDEEGIMRKYQFQVRQTEDGQFETVPGTIEIVPFEDDEVPINNHVGPMIVQEPATEQHSEQIFIKQESHEFINEESQSEMSKDQAEEDEDEEEEGQVYVAPQYSDSEHSCDTKQGILDGVVAENTHAIYNQHYADKDASAQEQVQEYLKLPVNRQQHYETAEEAADSTDENMVVYYNEIEQEEEENDHAESNEEDMSNHLEVYIHSEETSCDSVATNYIETQNEDPETDTEYIEDDMHVSGAHAMHEYQQIVIAAEEKVPKPILRIDSRLKHINQTALRNTNFVRNKTNSASTLYSARVKEKENMESLLLHSIKKGNPRSILKTSIVRRDNKKIEMEKSVPKIKHFSQAKQFQSYISQTKILEAPIRQSRLPRKQKIEPLERSGEEIIVQEVVVSANGFIETHEDGVLRERKRLVPTAIIQLSDSEEETVQRARKKRKRRSKNEQAAIIISDSEEDSSATKKSRSSSNTDDDAAPPSITELKKSENQCPKCPKSFPSAGSLRTHMQYHNYEQSNTTKIGNLNLEDDKALKYKCDVCGESFKNQILLTNHNKMHKNISKKNECPICKKLFKDYAQLATHKRSHIKEQMVKATSTDKISPKKVQNIRSEFKKPLKVEVHKCKQCSKTFSTAVLLTTHEKSHLRFNCETCNKKFPSKMLLTNHMLKSCVKSPKKRISYVAPRKGAFASPRLSSLRRSSIAKSSLKKTSLQLPCDSCDKVFKNHTDIFKHKVVEHGMYTPDKTVGMEEKKKLHYKPVPAHSGVPASKSLQKVFAGLRQKMKTLQP